MIDFAISSATRPALEIFDSVRWVFNDYASRTPVYHANIDFRDNEPAPVTTNVQHGFQYTSGDQKRVISARLDGFSFSRMPPYETWEPFSEEARRLFSIYCDVRNPELVTRVAVRYINRLELPLPINDFREYLLTVPDVAPALPQTLDGFVLQLKIPQQDWPGGMLILNEGLLGSNSETAAVLLDIDLFFEAKLDPRGDELWEGLEQLHARKNSVFESSITERMKELIR